MIRHLSSPPAGPWTPGLLFDAAREVWPNVRGCNEVSGSVAVYFPDDAAPTVEQLAAWDATVAAWVDPPAPPPEPDPVVLAAEAIQTEVDTRLAPSSVNSIAEVKAAIRDGLAAAVETLRAGA